MHQYSALRIAGQHLYIVRIREVYFADVVRIMSAVRVQIPNQLVVNLMRGARVERGSPALAPRITGNEYFVLLEGGNSISAPPASINMIFEPIRAKATGVRS